MFEKFKYKEDGNKTMTMEELLDKYSGCYMNVTYKPGEISIWIGSKRDEYKKEQNDERMG